MEILTTLDTSGVKDLSDAGQTLMSDFVAVFTAEADRNIMTKFSTHFWQNDLAEATWAASYVSKSGMAIENMAGKECGRLKTEDTCADDPNMECEWFRNRCDRKGAVCKTYKDEDECGKDDRCTFTRNRCIPAAPLPRRDVFRPNDATAFFAVGPTGSGIGDARVERAALQKEIAEFEWKKSDNSAIKELAAAIDAVISCPENRCEVISRLADLLGADSQSKDAKKILANGEKVKDNAAAIAAAATKYLVEVADDADAITQSIKDGGRWTVGE
jgi:hypothetical protein